MPETNEDRPEVWLPVDGYIGIYEISNHGRCRRVGSVICLMPVDAGKGYRTVSLCKDGSIKNVPIHRMVLIAFCGPEPFVGAQAAHNDGDRSNNRLTNLRWATPVENQADRIRHGTDLRGSAVFGAVLTEPDVARIRDRIRSGERNPQIANDYGVSVSTIHLIRHNKTWRHVA
jgi:hypothetical protein